MPNPIVLAKRIDPGELSGPTKQRSFSLEALEQRIVLSGGIGTGLGLKSATFLDALGDTVHIALAGSKAASFDLTLDGGVTNGADVDSLVILHGNVDTQLYITLTPRKNATDGPVEINSVTAEGSSALGGIHAFGASFGDISLDGVDIKAAAFSGSPAPGSSAAIGSIEASSIGSLSFEGSASDLDGIVSVTGKIGAITDINGDISGSISAGEIDSVRIHALSGDLSTSSTTTRLSLNASLLSGSIEASGSVKLSNLTIFSGSVDAEGGITGQGAGGAILIHSMGAPVDGFLHSSAGNISAITVSGPSTFSGVITADSGNIGLVTADSFLNATVDAAGSLGGLTAKTTTAALAVNDCTFHAGTTIGPISASASLPRSTAIDDSSFRAETGFTGPINAQAAARGSSGIVGSVFSTGGDITGLISAKGGLSGAAIDGATFSALGSLGGGVMASGDVLGSIFLAGYDVGPNGKLDGVSGSDDVLGPSTGVEPTIGAISVTGQFVDNQLAAGIAIEGAALYFGGDQANNTGGAIGAVKVTGAFYDNNLESGGGMFATGFTAGGMVGENSFLAYTGNIGNLTVIGSGTDGVFNNNSIRGNNIGNILVHNTGFGDAIYSLGVSAGGSVGDIIGIANEYGSGIDQSSVAATTRVGTIIGIVNGATTAYAVAGISGLQVTGGAGIGLAESAAAAHFMAKEEAGVTLPAAITGPGIFGYIQATASSSGDASGIASSLFNAGTGGIGAIVGITAAKNGSGIADTNFRASGDIGNITATAALGDGLVDSIVTTSGNIGNVIVTGNMDTASILAGVDLGINFENGSGNVFAAGKHIGNVTVTGTFRFSNLIASVIPNYGESFYGPVFGYNDTNVSETALGSIGTVRLQTGFAFGGTITPAQAGATAGYAIEAGTLATVTFGSIPVIVPTTPGSLVREFSPTTLIQAIP